MPLRAFITRLGDPPSESCRIIETKPLRGGPWPTKDNECLVKGIKLLLLLFVTAPMLLLISCGAKIDQTKFEPAYKSAKAIEGAIAVGVNYYKFTELVQNLATEVSVLDDKIDKGNEDESILAERYTEIFEVYRESLNYWGKKNQQETINFGPANNLPEKSRQLIGKYSIPTTKEHRNDEEYLVADTDQVIRSMWRYAEKALQETNQLAEKLGK